MKPWNREELIEILLQAFNGVLFRAAAVRIAPRIADKLLAEQDKRMINIDSKESNVANEFAKRLKDIGDKRLWIIGITESDIDKVLEEMEEANV